MASLKKVLGAALGGSLTLSALSAFAQQPVDKGLGFQKSVTDQMDQIVWFHDILLMPIITITTLFVLALLIYVMWRFSAKRNSTPSTTTHHSLLEVIWTAAPVLILIVIAIPSFRILYYQEVIPEPDLTIKVTGQQWYWTYEYPESGVEFDAIISNRDGTGEGVRLLSTDNQVVLPANKNIEVLLTAGDVIHAWTVPSFGVKKDAVPGRTNHLWFNVREEGTYYGQCSEICGVDHGYMPIEVKIVSDAAFKTWLGQAKLDLEQGREITKVETIIAQMDTEKTETTLLAAAE